MKLPELPKIDGYKMRLYEEANEVFHALEMKELESGVTAKKTLALRYVPQKYMEECINDAANELIEIIRKFKQ